MTAINLDVEFAREGEKLPRVDKTVPKGFFTDAGAILQQRGVCALLAYLDNGHPKVSEHIYKLLRGRFLSTQDEKNDPSKRRDQIRDHLATNLPLLLEARQFLMGVFNYAHFYQKVPVSAKTAEE